jgi:hypothetical protein
VELAIDPQQAGLTPEETRELYRQVGKLIDELNNE